MNVELEELQFERLENELQVITLTAKPAWSEFPRYAEKILTIIGGNVVKKFDTTTDRIWKVRIGDLNADLVYQDFPSMISLEAEGEQNTESIMALFKKFQKVKYESQE